MNFDFVNGEWVLSLKSGKYTANQLMDRVEKWFNDEGLVSGDYPRTKLFWNNYEMLVESSTKVNYGKDKAGKMVETPDWYKSTLVLFFMYVQSSAYCLTEQKAKETLNPSNAKDAKEIDKLVNKAMGDLATVLFGKPQWS